MVKLILGALLLVGLIFIRQQIRRAMERRLAEAGAPVDEMDRAIRRQTSFDVEARRHR
jgi:hypothetical protein